MNAPLRNPIKFDVQNLVRAVAANHSPDSFAPTLTPLQWDMLGSYLQPLPVEKGHALITQKATDRTLYLVEAGGLSVHYEDSNSRWRWAA
jgi:CRP/FNR family cyclic AMP-dependent transcriptional regulator